MFLAFFLLLVALVWAPKVLLIGAWAIFAFSIVCRMCREESPVLFQCQDWADKGSFQALRGLYLAGRFLAEILCWATPRLAANATLFAMAAILAVTDALEAFDDYMLLTGPVPMSPVE